jgi:hypothetical protein
VLVLGFSKGANQVGAIEKKPFDAVAFRGCRANLAQILRRLGISFGGQTIDRTLTSNGHGIGYASLVRCSIAQEKKGEWVSTGTIMPDALANPWSRELMGRCVRHHLLPMPSSVQRVVLLGNTDPYVAGVRELMREHYHDFQSITPMGFSAAGRRWIFVVHPTAQGAHIKTWLKGGRDEKQGAKCQQALAAFGSLEDASRPVPANMRKRRLIKSVPL